jgi:hypothetical protein
MNDTWKEGFLKVALVNSLIGKVKGLKSGDSGLVSNKRPDTLKPGVSMAPKSKLPPLPTAIPHSPERNLDPWLPPKSSGTNTRPR